MKVLFDLRDHPENGMIGIANAGLEQHDPGYLERYGRVGSAQWWATYDQGHITRTDEVGRVVYIGPNEEEHEAGEVVRIETDRGEIAYDREHHWADPPLVVGRWVPIERAKTIVHTRTGPMTASINVRIWVEDEEQALLPHAVRKG